ncbi:hypothetical protein AACH06_10580 [Ideonella sp. DXS29W]|uniref:ABC transporter permease n=1 Tax=Ideonella lacteola TaxID=2984193 RepID=A0ABU9BQV9_9BURK
MDLLHPGGTEAALRRWARFADPWRFYELAWRPVPVLLVMALVLAATGLRAMGGPAQAEGHDAERLLALHLPLAWLALALALAMLGAAVAGRLSRAALPLLLLEALAPTGALAALLALATGALWQQASGGAQPPWDVPVPAAAWPWAGAFAAQALAAVLLRVRLVIVELARRDLALGRPS